MFSSFKVDLEDYLGNYGVCLTFQVYGLRVLVCCLSCWNASMTKLSFGYFDEWE